MVAILNNVNSFIKKEEKLQAVEELRQQVEDWKGHELGGFGDLLMHGAYPVQKTATQQDREVRHFCTFSLRHTLAMHQLDMSISPELIFNKSTLGTSLLTLCT